MLGKGKFIKKEMLYGRPFENYSFEKFTFKMAFRQRKSGYLRYFRVTTQGFELETLKKW